ncbi:hypothetical protein QTP70_004415 [Hemibagrus guttatus]|uniref:Uncharacterized protein n=1 Tax=Hemibagrus guttatus TaxID=175788 RepID=A0AAE0UH12_9TELE|nr:hypothetical protein QTP70_004415 [Hemibagrus guttatus]
MAKSHFLDGVAPPGSREARRPAGLGALSSGSSPPPPRSGARGRRGRCPEGCHRDIGRGERAESGRAAGGALRAPGEARGGGRGRPDRREPPAGPRGPLLGLFSPSGRGFPLPATGAEAGLRSSREARGGSRRARGRRPDPWAARPAFSPSPPVRSGAVKVSPVIPGLRLSQGPAPQRLEKNGKVPFFGRGGTTGVSRGAAAGRPRGSLLGLVSPSAALRSPRPTRSVSRGVPSGFQERVATHGCQALVWTLSCAGTRQGPDSRTEPPAWARSFGGESSSPPPPLSVDRNTRPAWGRRLPGLAVGRHGHGGSSPPSGSASSRSGGGRGLPRLLAAALLGSRRRPVSRLRRPAKSTGTGPGLPARALPRTVGRAAGGPPPAPGNHRRFPGLPRRAR